MSFFTKMPALEPSRGPLYIQLERILRDAILEGSLTDSDALPTERDLADRYGISRMTVRRALTDLQREGLLTRRQGAGTFIAPRGLHQAPSLTGFSEDMATSGRSTHSVVIARSADSVTPDESMSLGLGPSARVYRFKRIRYADATPIAIEVSVVPWYCLPSEETVEDSLYTALQNAGNAPSRALQRLRAVALEATEAALLKVEPGTPGLFIERRGYLRDGRTAEVTSAWYRGDASDLVAEISIPAGEPHAA